MPADRDVDPEPAYRMRAFAGTSETDDTINARIAYATPATAPAWRRWLVLSPLARIAIFFILYFAIGYALNFLLVGAGVVGRSASPLVAAVGEIAIRALLPLIAYLILVRGVEGRAVDELAPRRWLADGAIGVGVGTAMMCAIVAIAALLGAYRVVGTQVPGDLVHTVIVWGIGAGIGEEIIARGVLFRIAEEGLGTVAALLLSAAYFGYGHIGNPHATTWSVIAIAVEGGLLLGLLYHVTRSLTVCIGLHAAWNVVEGAVFGIPVSGAVTKGWLVADITGPDWLTGGAFGIEASVIALGVCSVVTVTLLLIAIRNRSFVAPFWKRSAALTRAAAARAAASVARPSD